MQKAQLDKDFAEIIQYLQKRNLILSIKLNGSVVLYVKRPKP